LLSFLQPGLGHAYLRAWRRAVTWFLVWAAVTAALVELPSPSLTVEGLLRAARQLFGALGGLELVPSLVLSAVTAFAMVDAFRMADEPELDDGTPRCPDCGKEIDEDLDFCPWCTAELDAPREPDAE
jgi:hypothetical protein